MTLPLRIELAMTFKAVFPDILARDRSGHGHPEASEAVSGCNILILPVDASVLPTLGVAHNDRNRSDLAARTPVQHAPHSGRAPGLLTALALFSAKSGGTENVLVFRS